MARLRELLTDAGFENVATYIQSGNVFFDSSERSKAKLTSTIEPLPEQEFGFAIPVIVRTLPQLEKLIAPKPLRSKQADDTQRLLVTLTPSREWCDVIRVANGKWKLPN